MNRMPHVSRARQSCPPFPEPSGKAPPETHRQEKENASRKGPKGTSDVAAKPGRKENRTAKDLRLKEKKGRIGAGRTRE
jgi:hypothetical protein